MRTNRILSLLVAVALLGLAPVAADAATAPAPDRGAATPVAASTADRTAAREQLPQREIKAEIVNKSRTVLLFKGKVKGQPKYAKKFVKIERKLGKHKPWKRYAKVRTNKRGGWRHRVGFPRHGNWYWRAVTPKTGQYRKSSSLVWKTYAI